LPSDSDTADKFTDRLGRIASAAHPGQGRHPRIIVSGDISAVYQLNKAALAHYRVAEAKTGKLDLARMVDTQFLQEPVIERAMDLVFERAERVGDALDGVLQAMRPIVHRIDAPSIPLAMMLRMDDTVHDRVAQEHVRRSHINLCAQRPCAIGELTGSHTGE